jgi:hypothetical protein
MKGRLKHYTTDIVPKICDAGRLPRQSGQEPESPFGPEPACLRMIFLGLGFEGA